MTHLLYIGGSCSSGWWFYFVDGESRAERCDNGVGVGESSTFHQSINEGSLRHMHGDVVMFVTVVVKFNS